MQSIRYFVAVFGEFSGFHAGRLNQVSQFFFIKRVKMGVSRGWLITMDANLKGDLFFVGNGDDIYSAIFQNPCYLT